MECCSRSLGAPEEGTAPMGIDPRGPRFAALVTTMVLAVVLVTGSVWPLAAQAVVFAVGAVFGLRYSPYGWLYASWSGPGSAPGRARGRGAAAVRPGGRPGLRPHRGGWLCGGPDLAWPDGNRGCPGRSLPERRVRVLPGLRDVPDHPPDLAWPPGPGPGHRREGGAITFSPR